MFVRRLKLRPPARSAVWVERGSAALAVPAAARVVALVAGPGYGKTVFASQLVARWPGRALWYGCDDADADVAVFAAHLAAMLAGAGAAPPVPEALGPSVAQSLADGPPTLVVFDDAHHLRGRSLAALDALLRDGAAAGVTFVLSGRELPLPEHVLATRGGFAAYGPADLAFDEPASIAFLAASSHGRLGEARTRAIARRIEGWPAGLALAASATADRAVEALDDELSLPGLYAYLASEVLDAADEDDRRLLLETSILEDLEPDVCDAITGESNARARLGALAARGFFVARRQGGAFATHGLLATLLRERLGREYDPDARAMLHRRASAALASRGDAVAAIEHLLAAGDVDRAADDLVPLVLGLVASGRISRVQRLLDALGASRVGERAVLGVARGRIEHATGEWDRALATLERAELLAREARDYDAVADAVRTMASILGARREHLRLRGLLDATLALPLSDAKRATLGVTLGAHLLDTGRFDEVLDLYERIAPAIAALDDLALQGVMLHNIGAAHMLRGDPFPALGHYERALALKRSAGQRRSALVTLGNLCIAQRAVGETELARATSLECAREARAIGDNAMLAHALDCIGRIALDAGDVDGAAAAFAEARAVCDPSDTTFMPDALLGEALVALARGDAAEATVACARAATSLRTAGNEQLRAPIALARARATLLAGDPLAAVALLREAVAFAAGGRDALATATVGLEAAALAVAAAERLAAADAAEARAFAAVCATDAIALAAARDFAFLERTHAAALGAARELVTGGIAAPAPLRIEVLGTLRVLVAGNELPPETWKRRKAREVLAYLVCERGRAVPRSRLVDALWPDADADGAHDSLRVTISALRRAIGDVVRYDDGGYRLVVPAGATIDLVEFESALAAARRARDENRPGPARDAYAAALATYRGELLEGFESAVWHLRDRERLHDAALEAARVLAVDPGAAVAVRERALERLLELAPFDAGAMALRLETLATQRRSLDARREYGRWRERYEAAIGEPAPDIWPRAREAAPRAS